MNGDNILRSVVGHKNSLPHKATFTQGGRLEATPSRHLFHDYESRLAGIIFSNKLTFVCIFRDCSFSQKDINSSERDKWFSTTLLKV
jgi:hypothetical protein